MGWGNRSRRCLQRRCQRTDDRVKLLFIGDIVGGPGRRILTERLPGLIARHGIGFVIANGENSAGGNGITSGTAREIFEAGVDVITTGDHVWDQRDTAALLAKEPRILRPLNYPPDVPGSGTVVVEKPGCPPVGVLNLQGRTFMSPLENPFIVGSAAVDELRRRTPVVFVDFHAETTSEKIAFGRYVDGRVSAVVGTHTHVQTADEWVMPGGSAFLSDAGFTGPHDSVLGRDVQAVLRRFLTGMPQRFEVATGRVLLQGALVDIDESTGRARSIQRVSEGSDVPSGTAGQD